MLWQFRKELIEAPSTYDQNVNHELLAMISTNSISVTKKKNGANQQQKNPAEVERPILVLVI